MKKSRSWFTQQSLQLSSKSQITPQKLVRTDADRNVTSIVPGNMYIFEYSAKHKETLPYWDTFPLVFPFRKMPDGFIGLNLHYLPYPLRARLLDKLMSFKTSTSLDENTKLKFSWSTISGLSTMQVAQPCVHRYLSSHVKSPFKKIDAQDWATAMMLPVERFVGSSKQQVWSQSSK